MVCSTLWSLAWHAGVTQLTSQSWDMNRASTQLPVSLNCAPFNTALSYLPIHDEVHCSKVPRECDIRSSKYLLERKW